MGEDTRDDWGQSLFPSSYTGYGVTNMSLGGMKNKRWEQMTPEEQQAYSQQMSGADPTAEFGAQDIQRSANSLYDQELRDRIEAAGGTLGRSSGSLLHAADRLANKIPGVKSVNNLTARVQAHTPYADVLHLGPGAMQPLGNLESLDQSAKRLTPAAATAALAMAGGYVAGGAMGAGAAAEGSGLTVGQTATPGGMSTTSALQAGNYALPTSTTGAGAMSTTAALQGGSYALPTAGAVGAAGVGAELFPSGEVSPVDYASGGDSGAGLEEGGWGGGEDALSSGLTEGGTLASEEGFVPGSFDLGEGAGLGGGGSSNVFGDAFSWLGKNQGATALGISALERLYAGNKQRQQAQDLQARLQAAFDRSDPFADSRKRAGAEYNQMLADPSAYMSSPLARMQIDELNRATRAKQAQLGQTWSVDPQGNIRGSGTGAVDFASQLQYNLARQYETALGNRAQQAGMNLSPSAAMMQSMGQVPGLQADAQRQIAGGIGMGTSAAMKLFPMLQGA